MARRHRYDNLKSVVLKRSSGNIEYNPQFLDFARFHGFSIHVCNPYSGNEKGRVERIIRDIRVFLYAETFDSLSDLNEKLLFFLAYSWPFIFLARLVDRIGKGVRTSPRDAMIADSCDAAYRGKAFGFHRAMDTIGACLGPLLAFWLLYVLKDDLRSVFLIAFVPAIIGVGVLIFWLKDSRARPDSSRFSFKANIGKFSPVFWKFIFVSAIFSIGNSSDAFLIMRAKDIGLTTGVVILTYVVYNISYSALSFPAGIISDKFSRKTVMVAGYLIFALVYFGFSAFVNKATIWPLFFIYGFYIAMTDGVSKAFVADIVDKEAIGTAMGLYHCLTGLAAFFASLIAGLLWTHIGSSAPFIYGAILALISSAAFLILL